MNMNTLSNNPKILILIKKYLKMKKKYIKMKNTLENKLI